MPPKNVDLVPWDTVCTDLADPYKVTDQKGNNGILNTMTFVDPATGWFEIVEITEKTSAIIS